jgi:hypothetical protein
VGECGFDPSERRRRGAGEHAVIFGGDCATAERDSDPEADYGTPEGSKAGH